MLDFLRRSMIARLVALAGVAMVTGGAQSSCSGGSGGPDPAPVPAPIVDDDIGSGNGPNFISTLVLRDASGTETYSFRRLEPITFEFTVRNQTAQAITLPYTGITGTVFVFESGENTPVWDPFHDMAFAQVISQATIGPGESQVFRYTWRQELNDGGRAPPGHYQGRGLFMTPGVFGPASDFLFPHELGSNLRSFTIR